jgi:hypothetical protein
LSFSSAEGIFTSTGPGAMVLLQVVEFGFNHFNLFVAVGEAFLEFGVFPFVCCATGLQYLSAF